MKLEDTAKLLNEKITKIDQKISVATSKINEYMSFILTAPDLLANHSTQYVQNFIAKYLTKLNQALSYIQKWVDDKIQEITKWINGIVKKVIDFTSLRFIQSQAVEYSYKTADYNSDKTKSAIDKASEAKNKATTVANISGDLQKSTNIISDMSNTINNVNSITGQFGRLEQMGLLNNASQQFAGGLI